MFHNGEHIPFMQELQDMGRETQLDNIPELDETEQELWELYCFTGDDVMISLDVYARRIGLPFDWDFSSCLVLMGKLKRLRMDLEKQKRENNG